MLVAQISDLHVVPRGGKLDKLMRTPASVEVAVQHLCGLDLAPDAVLVSGDLVDRGSEDEYLLLLELLKPLTMPVYLIPGNHDDRDVMRAVVRDAGHDYLPESGFLHYACDLGDLRLVALDTVVPGQPGGLLCPQRLAWLDECLAASDKPTLIMQHHPPFKTGMVRMDDMGLEGSEAEEAIVRRHPQVERILSGHLHRSITRRFGSTIASTAPSTAIAVELGLGSPERLAVIPEPPACLLHFWRDDSLVTHLSYVDDFGPAHLVQL